jgi:hypothetical protein
MPSNKVWWPIVAVLALSCSLVAQTQPEMRFAPAGRRAALTSIFISPKPNAPFTTTLNTQWDRTQRDGAPVTLQNQRLIMRDSAGRIFQERVLLTPSGREKVVNRFEISDPVTHQQYFCYPNQQVCELRDYATPEIASATIDAAPGTATPSRREDLGKKIVSGVETVGTRETTVLDVDGGADGQSPTITNEFWYSPQLGMNLIVNRADPRSGNQYFEVHDLIQGEPDPSFFLVPAGYNVIDKRGSEEPGTIVSGWAGYPVTGPHPILVRPRIMPRPEPLHPVRNPHPVVNTHPDSVNTHPVENAHPDATAHPVIATHPVAKNHPVPSAHPATSTHPVPATHAVPNVRSIVNMHSVASLPSVGKGTAASAAPARKTN